MSRTHYRDLISLPSRDSPRPTTPGNAMRKIGRDQNFSDLLMTTQRPAKDFGADSPIGSQSWKGYTFRGLRNERIIQS